MMLFQRGNIAGFTCHYIVDTTPASEYEESLLIIDDM